MLEMSRHCANKNVAILKLQRLFDRTKSERRRMSAQSTNRKHRSRRKCQVREKLSSVDCDTVGSNLNVRAAEKSGTMRRAKYLFVLYSFLSTMAILLLLTSQSSECLVININPTSTSASNAAARENRADSQQVGRLTKRAATFGGAASAKLQEVDAIGYLQRYGYMNGTLGNANLISEDSFHEAVMSFQRFAGIPETGSVDGLTIKYMQMPRCGNKDRSGKGENGRRRRKRYALQGSKWRRQELTYRISQYPTRFLYKKHEVDGQIEKAFKIWSQVAPIDFVVKREGRVHIDIRFASGEHGDGDPFDGPGNTLAHAYFPQYGGDAHFDDQEYWTVDSYTGTNIFQVAAHELGHSLGLGHSSVREALMAPFYQKYKPNFKLHADDVLGIQALYGEKTDDTDNGNGWGSSTPSSTTTTTTTRGTTETPDTPDLGSRRRKPPASSPPNTDNDDDDNNNGGSGFFGFGGGSSPKPVDLCQDSSIDAITRTEDGNTYVFRGQHYWQIKNEGLASGFPAKISRDWDGLPGNLDAALTWSDGKTFFFKGDKYWRFFNKRREPGYPKLISAGFAGIPNNVDAAFVWSGNGKTYFFKRDKYWRFDSKQEPPVGSQYPKSIKNWSGLPSSGVDAAFKWENGMTYFFKDDLYYRFDDREFEVDTSAKPAFPRSTAEWWFGCTNSNLPIKRKSSPTEENSDNNSAELTAESSSTSSSLLFHRKPNLLYDIDTPPSSRPRGSSISRSILEGLSSLFPSTSSSSSSSSASERPLSGRSTNSASSSDTEDWSFHRGIGEEVRRLLKGVRSVTTHGDNELTSSKPHLIGSGLTFSGRRAASGVSPDNSRWSFPLSSSTGSTSSSSREQSLSELRMAPNKK